MIKIGNDAEESADNTKIILHAVPSKVLKSNLLMGLIESIKGSLTEEG